MDFLKFYPLLFILILHLTLSACVNPKADAEKIASKKGFSEALVKTDTFTLTTFKKIQKSGKEMTLYVEGDGHTWISRTKLSSDPTPHNPLALKLALLDPNSNVAYLARPCQYTAISTDPHCVPEMWSHSRFSEKVMHAMNQAVDQLKQEAGVEKINLVGFSGGAAVIVLLAARRNDVLSLRTVSGDLDHDALSAYHRTTPLQGSLNPKAMVTKIAKLPQEHFVGSEDTVVPTFIAEDFVKEVQRKGGTKASTTIMKDFTHHEGWEKWWPSFLTSKSEK